MTSLSICNKPMATTAILGALALAIGTKATLLIWEAIELNLGGKYLEAELSLGAGMALMAIVYLGVALAVARHPHSEGVKPATKSFYRAVNHV